MCGGAKAIVERICCDDAAKGETSEQAKALCRFAIGVDQTTVRIGPGSEPFAAGHQMALLQQTFHKGGADDCRVRRWQDRVNHDLGIA